MNLLSLVEHPLPESEPSFDWTLFSNQNNQQSLSYLIYACQRDFLSTPRSFMVLELSNKDNSIVNTTVFDMEDYCDLLQIQSSQFSNGFYQINQNTDENIFLFVCGQQLIEISADRLQPLKMVYHCLDSKMVLQELIT